MSTYYQTLRTSFDYLTPDTLVSVITDTVTWNGSNAALATDIRNAAWAALLANAGAEEAIELIMDAGLTQEDVEDAS